LFGRHIQFDGVACAANELPMLVGKNGSE